MNYFNLRKVAISTIFAQNERDMEISMKKITSMKFWTKKWNSH
jgi:hypothetical protein